MHKVLFDINETIAEGRQVILKNNLEDGTSKPTLVSHRMQWAELPERVREGIEAVLRSSVVEALSQSGGYSPGTADRVLTASGQRFFVKAVGVSQNPDSANIHRREIDIMERLGSRLGSTMIGSYDDGEWVGIVFEDISGRHPDFSLAEDREKVMESLQSLVAEPLPKLAQHFLPKLPDDVRHGFQAWERLKEDTPDNLDPWIMERFDMIADMASRATGLLAGEYISHTDLRKDNILITAEKAYIVDWPWLAIGAPWFDALTVSIDAGVEDESFDINAYIKVNPILSRVSMDDVNSVIAALMGYFFDSARKPAPSGISSLRDFQYAEGMAALRVLKERVA